MSTYNRNSYDSDFSSRRSPHRPNQCDGECGRRKPIAEPSRCHRCSPFGEERSFRRYDRRDGPREFRRYDRYDD